MMESLWLLIPLSVVLAFVIGACFWWAAGSGQFDDLTGPGERILQDNDNVPDEFINKNQETSPGLINIKLPRQPNAIIDQGKSIASENLTQKSL